MKEIYFDGCSYTFGQGLELYCNPLDKFKENRMSHYVFSANDMAFLKQNRYSGIVSTNLGFFEKNKSRSGKSNGSILFDIKNKSLEKYEYCIIQLTHFNRYFTGMEEWHGQPDTIEYLKKKGILNDELVEHTINNIEKIQLNYFLELEKLFVNYPNKLKILFHSNEWESILSKEQIKKYGISIDGEYMIRRWAEHNNMFINQQPEFAKQPATSGDSHLTLKGHKILAESIIKQL